MAQKLCIIGAGPSGLALLNALKQSDSQLQVQVFEKQSTWGGLWNFNWQTGVDSHGEPVHNSMYKLLWINAPKEALEFPDYTFIQHFNKPVPSFLPREMIEEYINERYVQAEIDQNQIRFNTVVRGVEFKSGKFHVNAFDFVQNQEIKEQFDYLVCANGHFSTPFIPTIQGIENFNGRVLHSHDFRSPQEFKGQNVLCLGNSYSGEDIAVMAMKYGANSAVVSYRQSAKGFNWPFGIIEVPWVQEIQESCVTFTDGTTREFDVIVIATGYQHNFQFLSNELRLNASNSFWVDGLYKGVVSMQNPKLFYMGMQDQAFSMPLFDAQAQFIANVLLQRNQLPSKEEMENDNQRWALQLQQVQQVFDIIRFQASYIKELGHNDYKIDEYAEILIDWAMSKGSDLTTFREQRYTSVNTGTLGAALPGSWLSILGNKID